MSTSSNAIGLSEIGLNEIYAWIRAFAEATRVNKALLTQLDSAIGDADHGANMERGMAAAVAAVDAAKASGSLKSIGDALRTVGLTLVGSVGGASGPLYGTLFLRMGSTAGGVATLDPAALSRALDAGLAGIVERGKAEAGDKTMYDALAPACSAMSSTLAAGGSLAAALTAAATAAEAGRDATTPMLAHKGRASYLGERSIGHQDPGATSAALLITTAAATLGTGHA